MVALPAALVFMPQPDSSHLGGGPPQEAGSHFSLSREEVFVTGLLAPVNLIIRRK
jgi:hypothetical protein